jgi:hypothetical protein
MAANLIFVFADDALKFQVEYISLLNIARSIRTTQTFNIQRYCTEIGMKMTSQCEQRHLE